MTTGEKYQGYYGNGKEAGIYTITRMTEKSVFVTTYINGYSLPEHREGINSVKRYINKGLWKLITTSHPVS